MPKLLSASAEAFIGWTSILSILACIFALAFGFADYTLPFNLVSYKFTLASIGFGIVAVCTISNAVAFAFVENADAPDTNLIYGQIVALVVLMLYIIALAV